MGSKKLYLAEHRPRSSPANSLTKKGKGMPRWKGRQSDRKNKQKSIPKCYHCGGVTHLAARCYKIQPELAPECKFAAQCLGPAKCLYRHPQSQADIGSVGGTVAASSGHNITLAKQETSVGKVIQAIPRDTIIEPSGPTGPLRITDVKDIASYTWIKGAKLSMMVLGTLLHLMHLQM